MKRIFVSGTPRKPFPFKACVAAIGVFDGLHRGHQKLILRAVAHARRMGLPAVVVTFHPHPASVLHPGTFTPYISTLEHRLLLIEELGADACVVIDFCRSFARKTPERFVQEVLVGYLGVKKVVVGDDFHFGADRQGTFDVLRSFGRESGFSVDQVAILKYKNINIKSTYIRQLISDGDLPGIKRLLARPYAFLGEVERGDGRGKKLGFPTANLKKENVIILPSGIYFVRVFFFCARGIDRSRYYQGLCFIGRRSTFKRANARVIQEVHLLDVERDLYGQKMLVEFLERSRDDRKFPDEKSLVLQIARDVHQARAFFLKNASR